MQKHISVLIVEDELIAAENLKEFLIENGYEVLGITDKGSDAITQAKLLQPDIIFMDIMLKDGLSGSEAAVHISNFCKAKIIFLTAYIQDEMVDYASQAQAAAYLIKPYNKAQILATLRLVLHKKEITSADRCSIQLINNYTFNTEESQLYHNEKLIKLGPKARHLFSLLCQTPDNIISNKQICMHIWNKEVDDSVLRALIYRIRTLLDETLIENVSGMGYKIISL
jgi:DNA-binding response OmpR family regulator